MNTVMKTRPVFEIVSDLMNGNEKYSSNHDSAYFEKFKNIQHPEITVVACSDARVQTDIFGVDAVDEIFVIRNIGNQIIPVFGSIDYGILHLKTPVLMILGHTHCGAMKAAIGDYENEPFDIIRELDHLTIPVKHVLHGKNEEEEEDAWLEAVERNVDYQVRLACKKYHRFLSAGKLTIIGAVDDFIDVYGSGCGKVIITNVNEITDIDRLKNLHVFADVDKNLRDVFIRRINN